MDYSIIRSGNKQYMVTAGEELLVDRLHTPEKKVTFDTLLRVRGENIEFGQPTLEEQTKAEILEEVKDTKKRGIKYKPGGYRKKFGHRQIMTKVRITDI